MISVGSRYRRLEHENGNVTLLQAQVSPRRAQAKAIIAPRRIGVCRSDLRELRSERFHRRDFGHEIVGDIVEVTDNSGLDVGERVVFDPHPQLESRTSGFATLVELEGDDDAVRSALVPVPHDLPDDRAVFAEPLACACHCVERLEAIRGAERLTQAAVIGAGMAGTLIAASLYTKGVPVRLMNPSPARIDHLRKREVLPESVLSPREEDVYDNVVLATASVSERAFRMAFERLRPGGRLLLFAGTRPGMKIGDVDIDTLRRSEQVTECVVDEFPMVLAGTHGAVRGDFEQALLFLNRAHAGWSIGRAVERLVTRRIALTEVGPLLSQHADSGFIGKVLVSPEGSGRGDSA